MQRHLALLGIAVLVCGCKVTIPGSLERQIVVAVKHHLTVRNKAEKNPLPLTPENLAGGKEAFSHYCIACHGSDGQNTGVPFADHMDPPPPSHASAEVQQYTDGQLKWVIDNGIAPSGMPASKDILNDDEIWSIVHYLRHLPRARSVPDPAMYGH